jgi:hypothetical protein
MSNIDTQIDYFFSWIIKMLIPLYINVYSWTLETSERIYIQGLKTSSATLSSFNSQKLLFLTNCSNLAIKDSSFLNDTCLDSFYEWSYLSNRFTKNNQSTGILKKYKWMSASLYRGDVMIADLTTWLENILVISQDNEYPPDDILVQAWQYDYAKELDSLEEYSLQIINEDADLLVKNLK